jgi:hypothetical protein
MPKLEKPPIDLDKFWAKLDALGAADYLPEGAPDDPAAEPDPRVFFDAMDQFGFPLRDGYRVDREEANDR